MDLNVSQELASRQEVRCSDCNHAYSVTRGLKSGRCPACGNIEYLQLAAKEPSLRIPSQAQNYLQKAAVVAALQDNEALALQTPDADEVEALLRRYGTEGQLWGALVFHFAEPALHAAYLSFCARNLLLGKASDRYATHQRVYAPLVHEHWQATLSEQMLKRVQVLQTIQWERSEFGGTRPIFNFGFYTLDTWKLLWFSIGFSLLGVGASLIR